MLGFNLKNAIMRAAERGHGDSAEQVLTTEPRELAHSERAAYANRHQSRYTIAESDRSFRPNTDDPIILGSIIGYIRDVSGV